MSGTHASLRIEIIDPVAEPLDAAWVDANSAVAVAGGLDEWIRSVADAAGAARRHVGPLTRLVTRTSARCRRMLHGLHEHSLQLRHDGNPRRGSLVRHHMFVPIETVVDRWPNVVGAVAVKAGVALDVSSDFTELPGGGRRAEATLGLRGSWPRLPVYLRVEPSWREQSVVTVELRTRRRLRYPRRYFRAAHASTRALSRVLSD